MGLTVLQVGYPLAPVGPDTVGGAEQVLYHLDAGLVARGHRSLVVAPEGSRPAGELVPVPAVSGSLDGPVREQAQVRHAQAIERALDRYGIDLVHLHGIDAFSYLPPPGVPVLVTLHLPPAWYPQETWGQGRPDTWLVPVSEHQRRQCPGSPALLPPVLNGVPTAALSSSYAKRDLLAAMGRICPEKGFEHAADAAKAADKPLLLAGKLYPYGAHQDYFESVLTTRLDARRRFIGPLGFRGKRRLLGMARALLVPSLCAETSSLASMEALACGTPVIAFPNGALPEVVEHGVTGFIVPDAAAMADAIADLGKIDPEACRATALARFSLDAMVEGYLATYRRILSGDAKAVAA